MSDIVDRAKEVLKGTTPGPWTRGREIDGWRSGRFTVVFAPTDGGPGLPPAKRVVTVDQTRAHHDTEAEANVAFIAEAHSLVPELIAEIERLHTWDGLMSLLDEYYPEDIFPTMEDREDRDPGPRIISLIRQLSDAHVHIEHWKALWRQNTESAGQAMLERDAALRDAEALRIGLSNSGEEES
jgi:hypothetical protein